MWQQRCELPTGQTVVDSGEVVQGGRPAIVRDCNRKTLGCVLPQVTPVSGAGSKRLAKERTDLEVGSAQVPEYSHFKEPPTQPPNVNYVL